MLNINKTSRTICNESCQKSQQLKFAEIIYVYPAWNILTFSSQNMDEEMSMYPGPRGFLIILPFLYLEICDAKRWSKRRAEKKKGRVGQFSDAHK